jgi:hypothetical protein
MDNIQQVELSEQQIRDQQRQLAARKGLGVAEAYARLDRGEFRGTILESELSMLRFLLGEDSPLPAAAE